MARNDNLISLADRPEEERKAISRKGVEASKKKREERKTLRNQLLALLGKRSSKTNKSYQENVCIALINRALKGDTKAFELIRDTIGEKEPEKINATINQDLGLIEKYITDAEKGVFNEDK